MDKYFLHNGFLNQELKFSSSPDILSNYILFIGCDLPDKDVLIEFDCYTKANFLRVLSDGIRWKRNFKAYTDINKLYSITGYQPEHENIAKQIIKCCALSHADFKHENPLWKNEEFYVQLPFKMNEDINPTKATHLGMTPKDLKLVQKECSTLLKLGFIEHTISSWACQTFYVNKRSEQVRGKKRLVIDYKPVNLFLCDNKFPIPKP